jgi:hypothetical protein
MALVLLWFVLMFYPRANIVLLGGQQSASMQLDNAATVTVQIASNRLEWFAAKAQRRLLYCPEGAASCSDLWLLPLWEDHYTQSVAIYRQANGTLVAVHYGFIVDLTGPQLRPFSFDEERAARRLDASPDCREPPPTPTLGDPPPSRYFRDLTYLGTFNWAAPTQPPSRNLVFRFIRFDERAEVLCGWPSRG